ncbi:F-box/kelch-repeat protein [Panicum miliaceum]|uniref:F-box/kelch-repeat protein n=1 Tax=Panicum miliaceum TaxID=4540 RepID=A0A3L6QBG8_PANMI|nr:F-box/kelch-repeat protein [Panicum miliaceum]
MGSVSKSWMVFIGSREFIAVPKEVGKLEEWIYVLTVGAGGQGSRWEPPHISHFACAEVNGVIYAAGGFVYDGDSLSNVEAYNPQQNKWILIQLIPFGSI